MRTVGFVVGGLGPGAALPCCYPCRSPRCPGPWTRMGCTWSASCSSPARWGGSGAG